MVAFFGVTLHAMNMPTRHHRIKINPVVRRGGHISLVICVEIIGVQKVKLRIFVEAVGKQLALSIGVGTVTMNTFRSVSSEASVLNCNRVALASSSVVVSSVRS